MLALAAVILASIAGSTPVVYCWGGYASTSRDSEGKDGPAVRVWFCTGPISPKTILPPVEPDDDAPDGMA